MASRRRLGTKLVRSLREEGPLATARMADEVLLQRFEGHRALQYPFSLADRGLKTIEIQIDGRFDRRNGTDTSGVVSVEDLDVSPDNKVGANWYEPISVKILTQLLASLPIDYDQYCFIDYGSGKGRVLLLASEYPFRKVVGVEFSPALCRRADDNLALWDAAGRKRCPVESVCVDAADYTVPRGPVLAFFYSPFVGPLFQRVVDNLHLSWKDDPRPMLLVFYGKNPESLKSLRATGFEEAKINLSPDWSRLRQYQGFVFRSPIRPHPEIPLQ